MNEFLKFLFSKTYLYSYRKKYYSDSQVNLALARCFEDVRYHYPKVSYEEVIKRIMSNKNELPIFLYRLARGIYSVYEDNPILDIIHWTMKECCLCEIYYSNDIDTGFYIVHGVGSVIGSRNTIGKGFKLYQGCTIGHKYIGENGCTIGDNVILYSNAQVIGNIKIGNNVVIGASSLVITDIPENSICYGMPAKVKK